VAEKVDGLNTGVVRLEWPLSPPNFFESDDEIAHAGFELDRARSVIFQQEPADSFDVSQGHIDEVEAELTAAMLGTQLVARKPFSLEKPRTIRIGPDGTQTIFVQLKGADIGFATDTIDLFLCGANGVTLQDTKAIRIAKRRRLSELVTKHFSSDRLLAALLRSYDTSIRDPKNELVHLYEIWDALASWLDGEARVHRLLGTTPAMRGRLTRLCTRTCVRGDTGVGERIFGTLLAKSWTKPERPPWRSSRPI
jgi:hypothetical protein